MTRTLLPAPIIVEYLDLTSESGTLIDAPSLIAGVESLVNDTWEAFDLRGRLDPGRGSLEHTCTVDRVWQRTSYYKPQGFDREPQRNEFSQRTSPKTFCRPRVRLG